MTSTVGCCDLGDIYFLYELAMLLVPQSRGLAFLIDRHLVEIVQKLHKKALKEIHFWCQYRRCFFQPAWSIWYVSPSMSPDSVSQSPDREPYLL